MTEKSVCTKCKYFNGFDGIGELWTGCSLLGDFKGSKTTCNHFEKKITKSDLLRRVSELEKENEQLKEAKYEYKQDWKQASANCDLYKQEIIFLKDKIKGFEEENEQLKSRIAFFEEQEDEFEQYTAQTIQNMIADYRDD